jgi:VanZ family protein
MKKKILLWAFVVLWMAVIFIFSHQPATDSSKLSSGIVGKIVDIIETVAPNIDIDQGSLSHIIRKCAHFGEYLVLGLLVLNGLICSNISIPKTTLLALLICVLYAVSDEIHQLFIPGRSGQVSDVLLDSIGALVGILLMSAIKKRR